MSTVWDCECPTGHQCPTDPISPDSDLPQGLIGVFSGTVDLGYQVDLALSGGLIGAPVGITNYPTTGGSGYLVLDSVASDGKSIVCTEHLTFGFGSNIDGGSITISVTPTGAVWTWVK